MHAAYGNLRQLLASLGYRGVKRIQFSMYTERKVNLVIMVATEKIRPGIEKELETQGIIVRWAATVKAAAGLLKSALDRTLVVTELALRDGNWRDVIEAVRSIDRSIPVLIVSSTSTAELWWDALECGVEDILPAPLSAARLREYLQDYPTR
ncbi:MAG: response regulator [Acidobacteriaceae bacterium]|nr:response regulator [Acidobacteriaceae bacterium]